jgi:chromosome segregation ATPase
MAGGELQRPMTRGELNRLLVANALTRSWPNVLAPAALAAVGIVLGLGVLVVPVAVVAWLALSAITYFDGDEAERVAARVRGKRQVAARAAPRVDPRTLAAPIAQELNAVLMQEQRIREAIERADLPFSEVSDEVDTFVRAAEKTAERAQLLYEYLTDQDPRQVEERLRAVRLAAESGNESQKALADALAAQLEGMHKAQHKLQGFYTEMERIAVELGNVRGQLLSVSAATEAVSQRELAGNVRDLREQMGAVADGMAEALDETSATPEASAPSAP